jgi:hypothetical protein
LTAAGGPVFAEQCHNDNANQTLFAVEHLAAEAHFEATQAGVEALESEQQSLVVGLCLVVLLVALPAPPHSVLHPMQQHVLVLLYIHMLAANRMCEEAPCRHGDPNTFVSTKKNAQNIISTLLHN